MKSITGDQVEDLQEEGVAVVVAEAMEEVEGEEGVGKKAIEGIQTLDG